MSEATTAWPVMSVAKAHALLTAPGSAFEMETVEIDGHALRTWKNAPRSLAHILQVDGGIANGMLRGSPFVQMDGQAVYRTAVRVLAECAHEALAHNAKTVAEVDWLVPHQANIRILDTTAEKIGLPMDKVVTTVARQGNTSAASVPLAFDAAVRDGRIVAGQLVLMVGVGAGMTWGSVLLRY